MSAEAALLVITWIALCVLALALAGLLKALSGHLEEHAAARVPLRRPGEVTDLVGLHPEIESSEGMRAIIFADADCSTCREVLPRVISSFSTAEQEHILVLFKGAAVKGFDDLKCRIVMDRAGEFERLNIPAAPFGVALDGGRCVQALPIGSEILMRRFVNRALNPEVDLVTAD